MSTIVCRSQVITWAIAALLQIPSQAAESFTQGRDSLRFLGTGADSAASESGATMAGEL